MQFNFDLISDLHLGPHETFDWTDQATSPVCVVAGDISRDIEVTKETLEHLGKCYQAVFYIDGNNEHRYNLDMIGRSYNILEDELNNIPNVVYLHNNCVIINGVAIIGTNGWWTWDFDSQIDNEQCRLWWSDVMKTGYSATDEIHELAYNDAAYLVNSVKKLQKHRDVKRIVIVTHTVPLQDLISHDVTINDTYEFNKMGNSLMPLVFDDDTENKIDTWCFGHYHNSIDQLINGVRYVNNCMGRKEDNAWTPTYYPKRITIDY
jgi:predicted phosphohydrolase